jgi:hypothetical protein
MSVEEAIFCQVLHEIELAKHPLIYQYTALGEAMLFPGCNVCDV